MEKIETALPGVYIIEPKVFGDKRGYFMETYSQKAFHDLGIDNVFVQDNQSFTAQKGTLRGIHFQMDPMAQCKIVRVTRGAVKDLAVDLRKGSPTYKKWVLVELSAENKRMLYIPAYFRDCQRQTIIAVNRTFDSAGPGKRLVRPKKHCLNRKQILRNLPLRFL